MKSKTCKTCFEIKELKEFPSWWNKERGRLYRPDCKPCWAKSSYAMFKQKQMAIYPEKWRQCDNDDCCHIYLKKHGQECPKCGEVNEEND